MPPSEPRDSQTQAADREAREQAIKRQLDDARQFLAPYIMRRDFPRSLRGYSRGAVEKHLDLILGWLSLSGLDSIVAERFVEHERRGRMLEQQAEADAEEIRGDARRRAERRFDDAHQEAERVVAAAREEADRIKDAARAEADRLLADARAGKAAERSSLRRLRRRDRTS
jgi:cell division septum initiation protein DivIVA